MRTCQVESLSALSEYPGTLLRFFNVLMAGYSISSKYLFSIFMVGTAFGLIFAVVVLRRPAMNSPEQFDVL